MFCQVASNRPYVLSSCKQQTICSVKLQAIDPLIIVAELGLEHVQSGLDHTKLFVGLTARKQDLYRKLLNKCAKLTQRERQVHN